MVKGHAQGLIAKLESHRAQIGMWTLNSRNCAFSFSHHYLSLVL